MRNYGTLSPRDFEILIRDLLQADWGERLETFPSGPDGGIDIRLSNDRRRVGIQCKHAPHANWSALQRSLRRDAARAPLDLDEFWLVTSARLTVRAKEAASKLLARQGLTPSRVLGQDDLENLLNLHPEVEQRHVHLHTTSAPFLHTAFHRGTAMRGQLLEQTIAEQTRQLVRVDATERGLDLLARLGYCVITGAPGIGKTSLAQLLLSEYLSRGYTLYDVIGLDEIGEAWLPERPQLFFCDDFLGQLALEPRLERGFDLILGKLLRALPDDQHVLVLTTRGHILTDAIHESRFLADSGLERGRLPLELDRISVLDRARILSSQMRAAGLGSPAFASLRDGEHHWKAVTSPAYNPRASQLAINAVTSGSRPQEDFGEQLLDTFADPRSLWTHVFWRELDDVDRVVLNVLAASPRGRATPNTVAKGAKALYPVVGKDSYLPRNAVDESLATLDRTLVTTDWNGPDMVVAFANPGIHDFVLGEIAVDPELFAAILALRLREGSIGPQLAWISRRAHMQPEGFRRLDDSNLRDLQLIAIAAVTSALAADSPDPWGSDERAAKQLVELFDAHDADPTQLAHRIALYLAERWRSAQHWGEETLGLLRATWPYLTAAEQAELIASGDCLFANGGSRTEELHPDMDDLLRLAWLGATQRTNAEELLRRQLFTQLMQELRSLLESDWEISYGDESERDADSDYQYFQLMSLELGADEEFDLLWERYYAKWKKYNRIWSERFAQEMEARRRKNTEHAPFPARREPSRKEVELAEVDRLFDLDAAWPPTADSRR